MKYTRIYTGTDGESYFEDIELTMKGYAPDYNPSLKDSLKRSEIFKTTSVFFNEYDPGIDFGFHTAPRRQFVICLEGKVEFTTSQGIKRRFGAGDILLAEDTTGKGHKWKIVGRKKAKGVHIPLE